MKRAQGTAEFPMYPLGYADAPDTVPAVRYPLSALGLEEAPEELTGISSVAATVRKALDAVARAEAERDELRELLRRVRYTYAWTPHGWHQTSLGARELASLLSEIDAHLGKIDRGSANEGS